MADFKELREILNKQLEEKEEYKYIDVKDDNKDVITIEVRQYLPVQEKADFIQYVINHAIDDNTGLFSPIRISVFYTLAILKFYCGIEFDEQELLEAYDIFQQDEILLRKLFNTIPTVEREFISNIVNETVEDISKYNGSLAGMLHSMNSDARELDNQIQDILSKIKNKEGLEILDQIKNVVGED